MNAICDNYKKCTVPCTHKHNHTWSDIQCKEQICASTGILVNCINSIPLLRKEKLKKLEKYNI